MSLEIHALMENTDDVDSIWDQTKKHDVRADRIRSVAGTNVVTLLAFAWIGGDRFDRQLDIAGVSLGLTLAPSCARVVLYPMEIGHRTR